MYLHFCCFIEKYGRDQVNNGNKVRIGHSTETLHFLFGLALRGIGQNRMSCIFGPMSRGQLMLSD